MGTKARYAIALLGLLGCSAGLVSVGGQKPAFWAGLFSLGWFSHGVMVAWSRPDHRELALIEIVLALVVFAGATLPGLQARFGGRR